MATKITIDIKKVRNRLFKGWTFVIFAGFVLAIIALVDSGAFTSTPIVPAADGSTGCQVQVTVATADAQGRRELEVRTAPTAQSPVAGTLDDGYVVDATPTVDGSFRQLEGGLWAPTAQLTLVPGTNCG